MKVPTQTIIRKAQQFSTMGTWARWEEGAALRVHHRITECYGFGRDFERSSSPIPLPEQEHPVEVTQEGVQAGFECLQRRRLHNLTG